MRVLVMWPCNSSHQQVESISPIPESGGALWFARTSRMRQTSRSRNSKPRPQETLHLPLSCFIWEFCNHYHVKEASWLDDGHMDTCSVSPISPNQEPVIRVYEWGHHPPADCTQKWTRLKPAEEPPGLSLPTSLPHRTGHITNGGCFELQSFGAVWYTAKVTGHVGWVLSPFAQTRAAQSSEGILSVT